MESLSFEITRRNGAVYTVLVDAEDWERVCSESWSILHLTHSKTPYVKTPRGVYLHRFLLNAPAGLTVDHINRNGLDNRKANLRLSTHAENCRNRGRFSTNTSGLKGVCWDKSRGKWIAQITTGYEHVNLGRYDTPEAAHQAYCLAAEKLHGSFASKK